MSWMVMIQKENMEADKQQMLKFQIIFNQPAFISARHVCESREASVAHLTELLAQICSHRNVLQRDFILSGFLNVLFVVSFTCLFVLLSTSIN